MNLIKIELTPGERRKEEHPGKRFRYEIHSLILQNRYQIINKNKTQLTFDKPAAQENGENGCHPTAHV